MNVSVKQKIFIWQVTQSDKKKFVVLCILSESVHPYYSKKAVSYTMLLPADFRVFMLFRVIMITKRIDQGRADSMKEPVNQNIFLSGNEWRIRKAIRVYRRIFCRGDRMKLIVINKLSADKAADIAAAVPGSSVECYASTAEAVPHAAEADAVATWGFMPVDRLLAAGPHIRWVHSLSDGVEALLCPALVNGNILLTNSHGIHDKPVAEHVMSMILAWSRALPVFIRQQEQHSWKRARTDSVYGKSIAIIGFGGIGRAVAERAKAFGMKVYAVKRRRSDELFADRVYSTGEISDVLPLADYVVCALPATKDTEGYFQAEHFKAMKKTAFFINIARGSIIDETALVHALQKKEIAGAGLDVFSKEPLPPDHPLWSMENVILTPHTGSMVPDFWPKLLKLLKDNFVSFAAGSPLMNIVDKTKGY